MSKDTSKLNDMVAKHSLQFVILADLSLLFVGRELKRKEMLYSNFADAWSSLYGMSTALNSFYSKI